MEYFIHQLLNGLAAGSIYALIAIGYNMVYGILELINFAHGDSYMVGTFIAATLLTSGLPVPLALLLACVGGGSISLIVERLAYRPVRAGHRVVPMISAVGAAMVLRIVAQTVWGPYPKPFPQLIPATVLRVGSFSISLLQPLVFALGMALMLGFTFLVQKTTLGKAVRCVAQDIPTSRLMGIEVDRIIQIVYFIGGFLGTAGGIMFSVYYNALWIGMGLTGTLKAWTATIVGGIGNLYAAFVGGLLLGVAEALISGYISTNYRDAIVFAILLIMLVLRPSGVLGRKVAQKV